MLRITAGEFRGRRLKVPAVEATRPLMERAREGLMNHLASILEGATIWDVYAGSGILGFEALSRGAARVVAVEKNGRAVRMIRDIAAQLQVEKQLAVMQIDAHRLPQLAAQQPTPRVVFFDPPYADFTAGGARRKKIWQLFLQLTELVAGGGCAVVHTPRGLLHDDELAQLPGIERRDYGSTSLYWWHRPIAALGEESVTGGEDSEVPGGESEA